MMSHLAPTSSVGRRIRKILRSGLFALSFVVIAPLAASASPSLVFETTTGATNPQGNPVSARATFTFGTNTLTIVLENTLSGNVRWAPNMFISGLQFSLSGSPGTATFGSGSGVEMQFDNSPNGFSILNGGNPLATTRWNLSTSPTLTALGGGQPDEMIIGGPNSGGTYTTNGQPTNFNPYMYKSATFVINYASGVDVNTMVSNVSFSFGTSQGEAVLPGTRQSPVPEPATTTLAGAGLASVGLFSLLRRRNRKVLAN